MEGEPKADSLAPEAFKPARRIPRLVSAFEILFLLLIFSVFAGYIPLRLAGIGRIFVGAGLAAALVASGALHDDSPARMGFSWPGTGWVLRLSGALACWAFVLVGLPPAVAGRMAEGGGWAAYEMLVQFPLLAAVLCFAAFAVAANRMEEVFQRPALVALGTGLLLGFAFARSLPSAIVFAGFGFAAAPVFRRSRCLLPPVAALWAAMILARILWPEAWHAHFRIGG